MSEKQITPFHSPFPGTEQRYGPTDTSDTPETDAFLGCLDRFEGRVTWSMKDIECLVANARKFERERNEARENVKRIANGQLPIWTT